MDDDPTTVDVDSLKLGALRTPRGAAFAGIAFALLTIISMVLIQTSIPANPTDDARWLTEDERRVTVAATLIPLAAIAFLWFIGVLRDLIGPHEDKFFGTVFLGSGLLFLGGLFVWVGAISAAVTSASGDNVDFGESPAFLFAGSLIEVVGSEVILRMAGVFMFSSATMWLQTGLLPRWLVFLTYLGALGLLFGGPGLSQVRVSFPIWVLLVSVVILIRQRQREVTVGSVSSDV